MSRFPRRTAVPQHGLSRRSFLGHSAFAAAVVAGTPLVSSCGSSSASPSEGGSLTFLSYLPMESLTFTPELLADAGGYFEEQGIEVEFETTRGSPQAIQTLLAGSALLTRLGQIELMLSIADRGAGMVNVGSVIRGASIRFVSSAEDPVNAPEDLVGKTMGIPSEGGTSETVLDLVLMNGGVDPDDVDRQVVGLTPGTFELVQDGRIAGYIVGLDTSVILGQQQEDAVVFDPGTVVASDSQVYVTTPEALDDDGDRDLLQRYLAAVHGAMSAVVEDEELDETLETLRGAYSFDTLDDTEIAKESLRQYVQLWTAGGDEPLLRTSEDSWVEGYAELTGTGFLDEGLSPEEWIDNGLLPEG